MNYVARQIVKAIRIQGEDALPTDGLTTPPHKAPLESPPARKIIPLEDFIICLVNGANVQVGTLLTTLIYLERLRKRVPAMSKGLSATAA